MTNGDGVHSSVAEYAKLAVSTDARPSWQSHERKLQVIREYVMIELYTSATLDRED